MCPHCNGSNLKIVEVAPNVTVTILCPDATNHGGTVNEQGTDYNAGK